MEGEEVIDVGTRNAPKAIARGEAGLADSLIPFAASHISLRHFPVPAPRAPLRSITLDLTSVMLLGQYDTWSVSRPNMPPFRACEHASSAVLHGSPPNPNPWQRSHMSQV